MSPKMIITLVVVILIAVAGIVVVKSAVGICDAQEWVMVQPIFGEVYIQDNPGPYWKGFAKVWEYDRNIEFRYNDNPDDGDKADERIGVTFNDGSRAEISTYIRLKTPISTEDRIAFHQEFGGVYDNIKASTKSFMTDCMKSTAPLMSASENQSAQKSRFRQLVLDQMNNGLYDMNLEVVKKKTSDDATSEEITLFKTTIKLFDGKPVITTVSPITTEYKMRVTQFSVDGTAYDTETRKQFAAKKEAFLGAEKAKAERSKEVQERLMIVEKGKREVAEAEAAGNVLKETAVIAAKLTAEVAIQEKIRAETAASQKLSVAELDKQTLLMAESAKFEQAQIQAQTAEELKKAMIAKAQGKKEAIELSGDITELEEAVINAGVEKAKVVAEALAKIHVPGVMIIGGEEGGEGLSANDNLTNILFLKAAGMMPLLDVNRIDVERRILREKQQQQQP